MKASISRRLNLMFILFGLLILGLVWSAQNFLLEPYYISQKTSQIEQRQKVLLNSLQEHGPGEVFQQEMEEAAEELHGRVALLDQDGQALLQADDETPSRGGRMPHSMMRHMESGRMATHQTQGQSGPLNYLTLLTPIGDYNLFFQVPLQPMEEVLSIAGQFNLMLAGLALVIALILSLRFSRSVTKPLIQLNQAVQKKDPAGFRLPWRKVPEDEIGQLGLSFQELTNQLEETIDALQTELDKEKSLERLRKQFVARVSHELQTPIALIQGYAEALEDNVAPTEEDRHDYLVTIQEETRRMSGMVKDLLDLEQLESGVFRVEKEPVDLTELLQNSLDHFSLLCHEKNIRTESHLPRDKVMVSGDPRRLEQVMNNLLKNAVSHTPAGGKISISLDRRVNQVRVSVYNDGAPIPEDKLSLIWESFYRGDNTREGTGLGLAIVKGVLDLHGSQYGVENRETGVEFYFTLS
ncbi:MAG: sensor histidine kinase [Tindallia sp. MSAO_Bac2]|nr:MAG: sensor histidine kinase [Tindallia sp. MSAO_Bac2]